MKKKPIHRSFKERIFRNDSFLRRFLGLLSLLVIGNVGITVAQAVPKFTVNFKDASLTEVLDYLGKNSDYTFTYNSENVKNETVKITESFKDATLEQVLTKCLEKTRFDFNIVDKHVMIAPKKKPEVVLTKVSGRVVDEKGNPVAGATIIIVGTSQGVASDAEGRYTIAAKPEDVLQVSFIGYKTEIVPIKGKEKLNIRLNPTEENLEEVTVVAFGEQKKESVVSAITTVRPMDLKSSNSDLTASFAGKIAGMIGWQTGGLPGALTEDEMNTKFYIRGITSFQTGANVDPLILIDGVESSKLDLSRMAPEDIESFSVLKDASATAMYGARGANGVILITTKRGVEGSVYTSVRYEAVMSEPTRKIEVVEPKTWMRMYNEALMTRNPGAMPQYSVERIERTGSPNYPSWVYPANDWYKIMFHDYSVNHRLGLNLRGGSNKVQYYASLNWNRDEGMLKTERLNQFDCNIKNNTFTFRTNMNVDLSAGIRLLINTSASLDKYHGPLSSMTQAYYLAFNASPVDFAPTYPGDATYSWPHIRFGALNQESVNPYMSLHQGYLERSRYSATARAEYIHNLSSLMKGLELRASLALSKEGYYALAYSTSPFMYSLKDYDFETGEHELTSVREGRRTVARDQQSNANANTQATQVSYEIRGLHTAAWGNHQTSLTAVLALQETTTSSAATILDGIPNRNMSFSMRGTYGFRDKYFIEGSFGYNGSERFDEHHRWGFFPAIGGAWVVSKEPFLADNAGHWLPFLKLRLSWGKVGNDGIINTPRYTYLPVITTGNTEDPRPNENQAARYIISSYANRKVKWEVAEQVNLGVEMKLFGGILEANADFYQEIRHNILDYRKTVPSSVGLENYQLANVGKVRSRGIDLSGKIQHAFTNDLWVIFNGTFTYSKAVYMEIEEAADKPEWQRRKGQEISQPIGYIAEGLFRDEAEVANSPVQGGNVMAGDIRYRDLNNDGVIDVNDATYIGFPTTPRVIYGFSGFVNFKNWEFSFSFQGSGKRGFLMDPMQINPFIGSRAMLKAIHDDHWSEGNMKERPFWPRLSTQSINTHNPQEYWNDNVEQRTSTYFMRKCSFLRCTSIELAYNLSKNLLNKLKMQNVKFYVRANNPFLISDFKVWDVELGESGFNYPIQRTYSVGLNVSF